MSHIGTQRPKALYSREEAREYLGGIGETLLWQLQVDGKLPVVKIGRRVMFRKEDLDRLIDRSVLRKQRRA